MPTAYGYIRVSSGGQAESGLSLDHQDGEVRKFFDRELAEHYSWGSVFKDAAVSAKNFLTKRPEGARLDAALRRGDVVVFAKLDRGFRNARDLLNTVDAWEKRGIRSIFLDYRIDTLSPMGKCMLTIGAAFAELERNFISERTKMFHEQARKEGRATCMLKFGMKRIKNPNGRGRIEVPDPHMHRIIAHIHALRKQRLSISQIYFQLIKERMYTAKGKEINTEQILKALKIKPVLEGNLEKAEAVG